MSLKHDIEKYPEMWSKEIVAALKEYKNGKRNSKRKLRKFVGREISQHYYNELIERHGFSHRMNQAKNERKRLQKIKHTLYSVAAFIILFSSMAYTLSFILSEYDKSGAILYFFLWLWAIDYALEKDAKSKRIEELERENERLKEKLKTSEAHRKQEMPL